MEAKDIVNIFQSVQTKYSLDVELKTKQIDIVRSVLNGRNTFGLLPTGYGKSLCFTLPPLILDELDQVGDNKHLALVISPLQALMKDQVDALRRIGVDASDITELGTVEDVSSGRYSVVFSSPEAVTNQAWRSVFMKKSFKDRICLLCFDEAHCISEWGEDFRPSYKEVGVLRSLIEVPVLVLTATCTEKVKVDVFRHLALHEVDTHTIALLPDRPNISLHMATCKQDEETLEWLVHYIGRQKEGAAKVVVYCRSVGVTAEMYCYMSERLLLEYGIDQSSTTDRILEMFHRTIDTDSKDRITQEFRKPNSTIRCLISTVAFGMGIEIADISVVVHWGSPGSVLTYWQEVGRAGRNGEPALALCFAYPRSLTKQSTNTDMASVVKEKMCIRHSVLQHLVIRGMDVGPLDNMKERQQCNGRCEECRCSNCICCINCFNSCLCPRKHTSFTENFGFSI